MSEEIEDLMVCGYRAALQGYCMIVQETPDGPRAIDLHTKAVRDTPDGPRVVDLKATTVMQVWPGTFLDLTYPDGKTDSAIAASVSQESIDRQTCDLTRSPLLLYHSQKKVSVDELPIGTRLTVKRVAG